MSLDFLHARLSVKPEGGTHAPPFATGLAEQVFDETARNGGIHGVVLPKRNLRRRDATAEARTLKGLVVA
jgi:hypothetical protein